jgi:hypothetical protein
MNPFMSTLRNKTFLAFALALTASFTSVNAAVVTSTVSYATLGLAHTSWLVDASATSSDASVATVSQADFPAIVNGGPYRTFMSLDANTESNGVMATHAGLRAGGRATSTSTWQNTIVNKTGASNSYSMNIALTDLFFFSGGWTSNSEGRVFLTGYSANVYVNGVSVWNSAQTLRQLGTYIDVVKTGFNIGNGVRNSSCSSNNTGCNVDLTLNDYFGAVNLGNFNNGQAFNVSYVLSSFSYWDDPNGCSYECGEVVAYASDPFDVDGNRIVSGAVDVPEPASVAMILAGLALMGLMIRRRQL